MTQWMGKRAGVMMAGLGALLAGGPVQAQPAPAPSAPAPSAPADARVAEMLEAERDLAHAGPAASPDCPAADAFQPGQQITVCARHTDTSRYRMPSSQAQDPRSLAARHDGALHAPYVGSLPDCSAPEVHCHAFGYAPPPVYYLDTTTLPEPAPGTDAWKIAHGEARGR